MKYAKCNEQSDTASVVIKYPKMINVSTLKLQFDIKIFKKNIEALKM